MSLRDGRNLRKKKTLQAITQEVAKLLTLLQHIQRRRTQCLQRGLQLQEKSHGGKATDDT